MKTIYDKLNGSYGHDSPNEHLAVDIKYCAIHFQTLYVKETWEIWDQNLKTLYSKVHRNNMNVYLGKDRQYASPRMTATHATVTGLNVKLDNVGQKLSMYNLFSSPTLKIYILWQ